VGYGDDIYGYEDWEAALGGGVEEEGCALLSVS
jgi:hypothetical protein